MEEVCVASLFFLLPLDVQMCFVLFCHPLGVFVPLVTSKS